jgi:queuine/archaeosine tRNA-ribosyltransferase
MTIHNLHFYLDLARQAREAIENDSFEQFAQQVFATYPEAMGKPEDAPTSTPPRKRDFCPES